MLRLKKHTSKAYHSGVTKECDVGKELEDKTENKILKQCCTKHQRKIIYTFFFEFCYWILQKRIKE